LKPTILVPYDFSPAARAALGWAADLQKTTGAGPLRVIYAVSALTQVAGDLPVEPLLPSQDQAEEIERSLVEVGRMAGATVYAKVVLSPKTIGDIILNEASSTGADLIVMGTHGRGALRRVFLGSVADHVVRHASCPVVTFRTPGARASRAVDDRQAV
jgi:nucleotide-binding universal stress UspA family protein